MSIASMLIQLSAVLGPSLVLVGIALVLFEVRSYTSVSVGIVIAMTMALAFGSIKVSASTVPPPTISRYMVTGVAHTIYMMGWGEGRRADNAGMPNQMVILDFGKADWNGDYGADGWGTLGFAPRSQIESMAENYMWGYHDGIASNSTSFLNLAVGTNNCTQISLCNGSYTGSSHGQAWGNMVIDLNNWITNTAHYGASLYAVGAMDMETGWDGPSPTRAWASGFSTTREIYFDNGDAGGCSADGSTTACSNGWTEGDVYAVSGGSGAYWSASGAPEIYYPEGPPNYYVMAAQWYYVSRWGVAQGYSRSPLNVPLSQYQACIDQGASGCLTPTGSWNLLSSYVDSDSRTSGVMIWSSQMAWNTN